MKRVSKKEDVPAGHHYSVLVYKTSSTYVEGDERSRTHPGHGYPGGYETHESFEHFVSENKTEWENFVIQLVKSGEKNFVFFEVNKLGVFETKIQIG